MRNCLLNSKSDLPSARGAESAGWFMRSTAAVCGVLMLASCSTDQHVEASPVPSVTQSASAEASPTTEASIGAHPKARLATAGDSQNQQGSEQMIRSYNSGVRAIGEVANNAGQKLADSILIVPRQAPSMAEVSNNPDKTYGWLGAAAKQIGEAGLSNPIIVMEPSKEDITTQLPGSGSDDVIKVFYKTTLRGIDAQDIGTVAVVPEPLVGGWSGVDAQTPSLYPKMVNHQLDILEEAIPGVSPSVMIDTAEAAQLLPYLGSVQADRLASVGIQTFSNSTDITFKKVGGRLVADVEAYMQPDTIKAVVNKLDYSLPVWINTGIGQKNLHNAAERAAIAEGIARVVAILKQENVNVAVVNIFMVNVLEQGRDFGLTPSQQKDILPKLKADLADLGVALSITGEA